LIAKLPALGIAAEILFVPQDKKIAAESPAALFSGAETPKMKLSVYARHISDGSIKLTTGLGCNGSERMAIAVNNIFG
jgi:hypothetical protein